MLYRYCCKLNKKLKVSFCRRRLSPSRNVQNATGQIVLHSFIHTASCLHHAECVGVQLVGLWSQCTGRTVVVLVRLVRLQWAAQLTAQSGSSHRNLLLAWSTEWVWTLSCFLLHHMKHLASCVLFDFCCHGDHIPPVDCCHWSRWQFTPCTQFMIIPLCPGGSKCVGRVWQNDE